MRECVKKARCAAFLLAGVLLAVVCSEPAAAENLHRKFGSGWNCDAMSDSVPYRSQCRECERRGMEFFLESASGGRCVGRDGQSSTPIPTPPASLFTGTTPPAAQPAEERWGALAGATWRNRSGIVQVAVGSAIRFGSESDARARALQECRNAGGRDCRIATTWTRGCGYITTGRNRRGAGWNSAASLDETLSSCRAKGYTCKTPIGGCNN